MNETNVTKLKQPDEFTDHLTDILRVGAQKLIAQAVEAELASFLADHAHLKTQDGRQRVVRHGYLPDRKVQTGIGSVSVRKPRTRDRSSSQTDKISFTSLILPNYMRRSPSLDEVLPYLYLKGISLGDFQDALKALLGADAPNLSRETIRRLKAKWQEEWQDWRKRGLSAKRYVYIWADGIYLQARKDDKQCILVIIGATPEGKKELVGFLDGYRESAQSWRELLIDLRERGLAIAPELAIGDGAMGFWAALSEVYGTTKHQRCWVHKTANVLNKMPKSVQSKAKLDLQEIWMAENKKTAEQAFDKFIRKYKVKYEKAVKCLKKDRAQMLIFYDFPAEHWKHIRTTNPIESTFATVRHRTISTKGNLSRKTALTMVFKLVLAAQKQWLRLNGNNQLPKVIQGVIFKDGIEAKTETQISAT